ncbi:MAG: Type secretion system domain protein [Lachnospiraceae bacterium]|jgi:tight adherence protein B|nr:Type secretion system domain protein [Lachnospiraceae bacterium]
MQELLLLLVFVSVILFIYSIYLVAFSKRLSMIERLERNVSEDNYYEENSNDKSILSFNISNLNHTLAKLVPHKEFLAKKKHKLAKAAVLMKPEEFLGISFLSGVLAGLFLYYLLNSWFMIVIGFILGFKFPDIILDNMKHRRIKKLNHQLPEALSIVSNGIRAGYSFTQAMTVASKELPSPISDEFKKVIRDNALGKPMEVALLNMSERTEDEDIDMFVTALIIQRQVGGNLTEILDTICNTIRERVRVKGEITTLTAQGKFSAVIVSIMPIAIASIIAILNPTYIGVLFNHTIGIIILAISGIMQVTGIILLRKIVNIDI